ncbi:MAG: hypothetical protein ACOYM3_21710 [Terrimicrobiaceae bacterium]
MKLISRFGCIFAGILLNLSALRAEDRVIIDWSAQATGLLPPTLPDTKIQVISEPEARVIDSTTDPKPPFEGSALFVQTNEGKGGVNLAIKPFGEPVRKGWIGFQAALQGGAFDVELFANVELDGNSSARIFINPNRSLIIKIPGMEESLLTETIIEDNEPHIFRFAWDFETNPPHLQIQLDGQSLVIKQLKADAIPLDPRVAGGGVDRVIIGNSGGSLGNIISSE